MRLSLLFMPLLALPVVAADPPKHRADGDAAIAARRVLIDHCSECHGQPDKNKRQGRLWVNDWTSLVGNAGDTGPVSFVSLLKDDLRSQVIELMKDGSMPPGGRRPVPAEQVKLVEDWVGRGAPEYPAEFDTDTVLQLVSDDLARLEREQGKDFLQNVRYVSLAHLVDKEAADIGKAEAELITALAGRTHGNKIRRTKDEKDALSDTPAEGTPEILDTVLRPVVGSAGTVYRLNLTPLRWNASEKFLFEETKAGIAIADFRMVPFDLIQLEYPYAHDAKDATLKAATAKALAAMNAHRTIPGAERPLAQLRAVPFVRGDWLAKALMKNGQPTPLADDLDSLGVLAEELKDTGNPRAGTGPDFAPFVTGPKASDATAPSVWAWYQPEVSQADPPFRFTSACPESAKPVPFGETITLIGDSDKPVAVSVVEVQAEFVEALNFGTDDAPQMTVSVGKNTAISPNKTGRILPTITAANRGKPLFYLLFASPQGTQHHGPVVVRSKHEESAVWRVLPNQQDAAAGLTPPVRKLARIEIKLPD